MKTYFVKQLTATANLMSVPCTHITKDDGAQVNILGFNKAKIDQELGIQ